MIYAEKNFLNSDEIRTLLAFARDESNENRWDWSGDDPNWNGRVLFADSLEKTDDPKNEKVYETLFGIHKRVRAFIKEVYEKDEVYSDSFQIVRWKTGMAQPPHADAELEDGTEHPYPWRRYASIIYLNTDYEGGNTYFPNQEIAIVPQAGLLATWTGTNEYLHGVSKITSGTRYTCAGFWCFDPERSDKMSRRS
jgi:hypothetical protein